jgi:catabolite regulation protein CreA
LFIIAAIGVAATRLYIPSLTDGLTADDFPQWAVEKGVSAGSLVSVTIDPNGRVLRCDKLNVVGDPNLANVVCNVLKNKRLKRPTLSDGSNVYATGTTLIKFTIPGTTEGRRIDALRTEPDAEISVNRLSAGDPIVSITLGYNSSGKVIDCAAADWEKDTRLASIACSQRSIFDGAIFKDPSGQPVSYVTWKKVRFTTPSQAK